MSGTQRFEKISVIIPTLNDDILRDTVDHLLAAAPRSPVPIEIVIAGKDEARNVADDDRVCFHDSERRMIPAEARNFGATHATGDLFLFLDSDAFVEPDFFEHLVPSMGELREVVHGAMNFVDDTLPNLGDNVATFHGMHTSCPPCEMDVHMAAYCLAVTRRVFEELGGFNENIFMAEDWEFAVRLRAAHHRIYFEPSVAITHHSNRHTLERVVSHARTYAMGFVNMMDQGAETGTRFRVDWFGHLPPLASLWSAFQATWHTRKLFRRHPAMAPYRKCRKFVWHFYYARRRHILRIMAGKAPRKFDAN